LTSGAGSCRGRFWVLEEAEGDDSPESGPEEVVSSDVEVGCEQNNQPTVLRLDGFVQRAEELGGALKLGRRTAFAPGGRGSWVRPRAAPRFRRLGDSGGPRARRAGAREGAARSPRSAPAGDRSVAARALVTLPESP
jgi:hypothetical protein